VLLADIDRALARYRQAVEAMTANLLELEGDPVRKLLDEAPLTGTTQARWGPAATDLRQVWTWFGLFQEVLARATELRGTWANVAPPVMDQLSRLLGDRSIELAAEQVPLAQRRLLGPAQTSVVCSPDELLARMEEAFDRARAVVTAVAEVWNELLPRLDKATADLADLERLARSVGEAHPPELAGLSRQLADARSAVGSDPLSVGADQIGRAEADLASARNSLGELADLRAGMDGELASARATLAGIEQVTAEARTVHAEVVVKIASTPGRPVPEPVAPDPALAARLDHVGGLRAGGDWRAARQELSRWTRDAQAQLAAARQAAAAIAAPLAERNELRGRLDAYRAKAARLGVLEDPALVALYDQAREVLYTAPTDVAAAADLVARYQRALPAPAQGEGGSREL
jgi:hypothetical protein